MQEWAGSWQPGGAEQDHGASCKPQLAGDVDAEPLGGRGESCSIADREQADRVVHKSAIDGDEFQEPRGRCLGKPDRGPISQRNIELVPGLLGGDAGKEKIICIGGEHQARPAFPPLHMGERKFDRHDFADFIEL